MAHTQKLQGGGTGGGGEDEKQKKNDRETDDDERGGGGDPEVETVEMWSECVCDSSLGCVTVDGDDDDDDGL